MTRDLVKTEAGPPAIAGASGESGLFGDWSGALLGEGLARRPAAVALEALRALAGGPALIAEWEATCGAAYGVGRAQAVAERVLAPLGEGERRELVAGFEAMPSAIRSALIMEMALGAPARARPASADALARFRALEEGAGLVAEWRGEAARKLGVVRERLTRFCRRLEPGEAAAFEAWFDGLSPMAAAAIIGTMARD